jgi:hypothetical protein
LRRKTAPSPYPHCHLFGSADLHFRGAYAPSCVAIGALADGIFLFTRSARHQPLPREGVCSPEKMGVIKSG